MSLAESLSPTPERLRKGDKFERPEYSPTVKRETYRALHKFEELYEAGRLDRACKEAGMRLVHHVQGMHGADVRMTGLPFVPKEGERHKDEISSLRHGQEVARARAYVLARNTRSCVAVWMALLAMAEETKSLEEIGRTFQGYKGRDQAYTAGLTVVALALEDLAVMWGLSQPERRPPSR